MISRDRPSQKSVRKTESESRKHLKAGRFWQTCVFENDGNWMELEITNNESVEFSICEPWPFSRFSFDSNSSFHGAPSLVGVAAASVCAGGQTDLAKHPG